MLALTALVSAALAGAQGKWLSTGAFALAAISFSYLMVKTITRKDDQ